MSTRLETTPLYRIDDLAEPRLPHVACGFNQMPEAVAARLFPLEAERLLQAARQHTGLTDFAGDDFHEPLGLLLDDLREDTDLTPLGRLTARSILLQVLETRLCIQHECGRTTEQGLRPIAAPLVIVGLPRTGTTHLHNLLSRVPALQFLPLWRSVAPFRPPGLRRLWPDLRRQRNALRLRAVDHLMPRLRAMHAMEVDLPHEELQLCAPAFRSFFFETSMHVPRYQRWYAGTQHHDAYAYLRRVLLLLQRDGEPRRWILKSPQHLDQLPALTRAFPGATILRTQRDPARAALSLITMILYARRALYRHIDVRRQADEWVGRLAQMLRDAKQHAAKLPSGQVYDVDFDRFVANPVGTVEDILRFAGVDCDARTRAALRDYQRSAPRNRYGRIDYDYASLGLDADELRARLG